MDSVSGLEDECETASEVYQCGRDSNLPRTNQIFTIDKGNATVVSLIVQLISLSDLYNFGFPCQYAPPVPCVGTPWRVCKMLEYPCVKDVIS